MLKITLVVHNVTYAATYVCKIYFIQVITLMVRTFILENQKQNIIAEFNHVKQSKLVRIHIYNIYVAITYVCDCYYIYVTEPEKISHVRMYMVLF